MFNRKPSAAAVAALLFLCLNAFLYCAYSRARDLQAQKDRNRNEADRVLRRVRLWDESAIDTAVNGVPSRPHVVIAGSSAMMVPFWSADRAADPTVPAHMWLHHRTEVLADDSKTSTVEHPNIYNLATPLQMVSDTYIYADELLRGPCKPSVLILGVTPREFYDHDFPSPNKTLNFLSAAPFRNWRYVNCCCPDWNSRLDYVLEQVCIMFAKRGFVQTQFAVNLRRILFACVPYNTQDETAQFKFGTQQYARRYSGGEPRKLCAQVEYLEKLARLCQSRKIELVVVNLPLPWANVHMFGEDLYQHYCGLLKETLARCPGEIHYIDISHSPEFANDDFADTIHLNASGGRKLIKVLSAYIKEELCEESAVGAKQSLPAEQEKRRTASNGTMF